jgi:hypothetical protein
MNCTLCNKIVPERNTATFACGHTFHLTCVLMQPFSSLCSQCDQSVTDLPDIGLDRKVAIASDVASKIQQRQLTCVQPTSILQRIGNAISPLTPSLRTFSDYLYHNKSLSYISSLGFSPKDAVHERVKWDKISSTYEVADILKFNFKWSHMVEMGITPTDVGLFSWQQQQRDLQLDARKLLQTNISLSELADLKYTTHQLLEMGFDWSVLTQMGASVDSWRMFGFPLGDIKQYWNPSLTNLVTAGFYDKDRVKMAGWDMENVLQSLPNMSDRSNGRVLRLAF